MAPQPSLEAAPTSRLSPGAAKYLDEHTSARLHRRGAYELPRNPAVSGQAVADHLLAVFGNDLPPAEKASPKWQMFSEIVTRCAFDVAGNLHAVNRKGNKYNGFDDVFEIYAKKKNNTRHLNEGVRNANESELQTSQGPELNALNAYTYGKKASQDQNIKSESAYRKVLKYIPLYNKGIVQTPHPTETLHHKAIPAEIALHHAIETYGGMFTANGVAPDAVRDAELKTRMSALYEAMNPVVSALNIRQEIDRSVSFSELAFDALPHMMQGILDPAVHPRVQGYVPERNPDGSYKRRRDGSYVSVPEKDENGQPVLHGLRNTQPLTSDELWHFSRLIKPCTWSPGDRDSKPDVTVAMLEYGIGRNRELMALQYAVKIEEILQAMPEITASNAEQPTNHARAQLENVLGRILKSLPPEDRPQAAPPKEKSNVVGDKFLTHYCSQPGSGSREEEIARKVWIAAKHCDRYEAFASSAEMIEAVESARQLQLKGAVFPKYNDDKDAIFNKLDVLVAQMHCFGQYALRAQIRENAEKHEDVMKELCALPEAQALGLGADRKARAETLLKLLDNPEDTRGQALRTAIVRRLDDEHTQLMEQHERDRAIDPKAEVRRGSEFYETLGGMRLAANNPEAIPYYLIAECRDSTDILEALALLKLTEPGNKKHVEIVPLVEYREHMAQVTDMMKEAYENESFRRHHADTSLDNESAFLMKDLLKPKAEGAMTVADVKRQYAKNLKPADAKHSNAIRPEDEDRELKSPQAKLDHHLTVADVKRAYGLAINEEDNERPIRHTKMVMFAGSDIMKSAGAAGAAFTQHTIDDLRAAMLEWKEPVLLIDYTGSGGGVHRSQPVANSFETTQGRSMRQTSNSIAQKAIVTMSRFIKRVLGLKGKAQQLDEETGQITLNAEGALQGDKAKLGRLAQLNLGNLAGFPTGTDYWEKDTGQRCNAWMDRYQEFYSSPELACMLAFSAQKFVKLTSYAARPQDRQHAKADPNAPAAPAVAEKPKESYPPIVGVEDFRAIGYGAALNVSGSCMSLFFGASQFLHAKELLEGASIEPLLEVYLRDSKTQDAVNRATFGVVMADMSSAWRYLGMRRQAEKGGVTVTDAEGKTVSVEALSEPSQRVTELLAGYNNAMQKAKESLEKAGAREKKEGMTHAKDDWLKALSSGDKHALAEYALANVDKEYQQVSQVLLRLHSLASGKATPEADPARIHEQILETLPKALQAQIKESRAHIGDARGQLAEIFQASLKDEKHSLRNGVEKSRGETSFFNPIYYRMGACFECFENAPRAFTRPHWAFAMENGAQHQLAA